MPKNPHLFVCDCQTSMPIDKQKIVKAAATTSLNPETSFHRELCQSELSGVNNALSSNEKCIIACTSQTETFHCALSETGSKSELIFTNIRETSGWSSQAQNAGPKMAALINRAIEHPIELTCREISSDGMCLIYGTSDICLEFASTLAPHLPISLLMNEQPTKIPPMPEGVHIATGKIIRASGSLGAFKFEIENYAPLKVSAHNNSRQAFGPTEPLKTATASLFVDLSQGRPILSGGQRRDGYYPLGLSSEATLYKTALELVNMVGTFEKPIYIDTHLERCAHSRSGIIGCTKCLDTCPIGAITSKNSKINYDPLICAGCGQCAALCPTEALIYDAPTHQQTTKALITVLKTFNEAGGKNPHLLFHSTEEGKAVVHMLGANGDGLQANVIPIDLNEVTSLDHSTLLVAFAAGASHITILASPKYKDELISLRSEIDLANKFLTAALGNEMEHLELAETRDPDILEAHLKELEISKPVSKTYLGTDVSKREKTNLALHALMKSSKTQAQLDKLKLDKGAPYGAINVNSEKCTLCLACVGACPTTALNDNPDKPELSFIERQCIQCGLCASTCPESAIKLEPRYNFTSSALSPHVLHGEQPFNCIRCGTAFGVKSTIEKITEKLAESHWMFQSDKQIELIKMCDDCRILEVAGDEELKGRPNPKTTDDYLKEK